MVGAIPGLVVLGSIGKQTEQAMVSKSVSSTTSYFLHYFLPIDSCLLVPSLFEFLCWVSLMTEYSGEL